MSSTSASSLTSSRPHTGGAFWAWLPALHLLASLLIAAAVAALIYGAWFVPPYQKMMGGITLFLWMLGVDAICGPLMTWLLIRPHKTRRALWVDGTLIVCLQFCALGYGLHTLAYARPLALVFEVDRFRVLSYSDIPESELATVPAWFKPWSLQGPRLVGLHSEQSASLQDKIERVNAALQGVDAAQRPAQWQEYALSQADVLARARPLAELQARYPLDVAMIDAAAASAGADVAAVRWLPVTYRMGNRWVALIAPGDARILAYLPLDGFF